MYRSITSSTRIVRTVLVLLLSMTFVIGAASPALALSAKKKAVIATIRKVAKSKHLSASETKALLKIAKMESGYRPTARNHSCKGLFQLMTHFSKRKWANPAWNTAKAIRYIRHRYGTVRKALRFHYAHGWY